MAACTSHLRVARLVGHLGSAWVRANTKLFSQFLAFRVNSAMSLSIHAKIFLSFEARKGH